MTYINNSGLKFLRASNQPRKSSVTDMSLRDWFAGQIAAGLAAADDHRKYREGYGMTLEEWRAKCDAEDADYCYARADAMLARRSKGGEA